MHSSFFLSIGKYTYGYISISISIDIEMYAIDLKGNVQVNFSPLCEMALLSFLTH